jgi:hypothetical protein
MADVTTMALRKGRSGKAGDQRKSKNAMAHGDQLVTQTLNLKCRTSPSWTR